MAPVVRRGFFFLTIFGLEIFHCFMFASEGKHELNKVLCCVKQFLRMNVSQQQ